MNLGGVSSSSSNSFLPPSLNRTSSLSSPDIFSAGSSPSPLHPIMQHDRPASNLDGLVFPLHQNPQSATLPGLHSGQQSSRLHPPPPPFAKQSPPVSSASLTRQRLLQESSGQMGGGSSQVSNRVWNQLPPSPLTPSLPPSTGHSPKRDGSFNHHPMHDLNFAGTPSAVSHAAVSHAVDNPVSLPMLNNHPLGPTSAAFGWLASSGRNNLTGGVQTSNSSKLGK